jgi:hypothetical protein
MDNYSKLKAEATRIKLEVPLLDYFFKLDRLDKLRYDRQVGKEEFFAFEHQKTGSIAINPRSNEWYDHSNGVGGDIIKACQIFENKSFVEAIKSLSNNTDILIDKSRNTDTYNNTYKIDAIYDTITHPALTSYLNERGLNVKSLQGFAKQIHWSKDEKKYFGIGLENMNGSFAVRSSVFKGNINGTGASFNTVGDNPTSIKIFEGLIDFGSYRTLKPHESYITVILNSTANLTSKVVNKIKDYANDLYVVDKKASLIHLYLDNDEGGHIASKKLLEGLEMVEDRSYFYTEMGLNDVNDYLKAQQNEECERYHLKR